jgi:tetratricopeptide (TPR) repeat protein
MERGSWIEFYEIYVTAELVIKDKESLDWAHIVNSAALVETERGNAVKARHFTTKALTIREKLCPEQDMERSDAYNNYALMLLTESFDTAHLNEAEKYLDMAIKIASKFPDGCKVLHVRYLNLGRVYTEMRRFQDAEESYELGRKYSEQTFGKGTHFVGR